MDTDTEEETSEKDVWALLESPPQGCDNTASLYSWSLNYDAGKGPFGTFLDLIGWSDENIGEDIGPRNATWGYRELHELTDAITEYLADPHGVLAFVSALMQAEAY